MTTPANSPQPIAEYLASLASGAASATSLLDAMLARSSTPAGQAVYTQLFEHSAKASAQAIDMQCAAGVPPGDLAGLPISVKDLFDVTGEVTHAGSVVLSDQPPAHADAEAVQRLRRAGAVITGHTNMTEFAYSGLGLNPHYGTPPNPMDSGRIPGGSSSGAAVSVACGMAAAALGTDTGGSVRIPAALCGLTGFKPTQGRVPRSGLLPLSPTLDSIGPIAPTTDCCARIDAVLAGEPPQPLEPMAVKGLRLISPSRYVLEDMDDAVAGTFQRALGALSKNGALISTQPFEIFARLPQLEHNGGFTAAECYQTHRQWLATRAAEYDPRVRARIECGASISAADYLDSHRLRAELMQTADCQMTACDALIMPTVPIVAPRFTDVESDAAYARINALILRNTELANLLGLCAITLPCHRSGELPVGLMLVGRSNNDRVLLSVAAGIETVLNDIR